MTQPAITFSAPRGNSPFGGNGLPATTSIVSNWFQAPGQPLTITWLATASIEVQLYDGTTYHTVGTGTSGTVVIAAPNQNVDGIRLVVTAGGSAVANFLVTVVATAIAVQPVLFPTGSLLVGTPESFGPPGNPLLGETDGPPSENVTLGYNATMNPNAGTNPPTQSIAIGSGSHCDGDNGTGNPAFASIAIGFDAVCHDNNPNSIAIGNAASATASSGPGRNTAIGYEANAYSSDAIAIGTDAQSGSSGTIALGLSSNATGASGIAIGNAATATGGGTAIGPSATAAIYGLAIGWGTQVSGGGGGVAIGRDVEGTSASTSTTNEIALGTANHQVKISNNATGTGSALLGTNCPAVTVSAPYTWLKMTAGDGNTVYIPAWK